MREGSRRGDRPARNLPPDCGALGAHGSIQPIVRCPTCQAAIVSHGRPEMRFVRGGTLDQPSSVEPDVHIFTRSKLPWIRLPGSAPAFDVYDDSKALWPAASVERLHALMARSSSEA